MKKIKYFQVPSIQDSGFACLKMVIDHFGKKYSMESLKNDFLDNPNKITLEDLGEAPF